MTSTKLYQLLNAFALEVYRGTSTQEKCDKIVREIEEFAETINHDNWVNLSSTSIRRVKYNQGTQLLTVEFNNGGVYSHPKVPQSVFIDLIQSKSVGNFYNKRIKGIYGLQ